ncbi:MAG: TetR/AcrR family transcriptional regulator [Chloroflexi bacterium]|uniref:TetR/AcrR family transcriptional regulator n=1 Tax=Candidatus Chlorohelix allophototropha TaxID=3003348 RepID=A0A8T7MA82_9CHLR|nr:TetR/AcrR family transcriptional regulator [Chloroflexota bacterium]WJW68967.1 TetR/AcrR family transcriptional regulator [Chloroflexota bacterium L227-S17]
MSAKKPRDTETRRKLLTAAEELFDQLGYEDTGIRDVMERVGVKEPTVYYYFKDKKTLFIEVMKRKLDRFFRRMQEATKEQFLHDQLVELAIVLFEESHNRVSILREVMQFNPLDQYQNTIKGVVQSLNSGVAGNLERVMREGIRRGELQTLDPAFLARSFLYLVEGFAAEPISTFEKLDNRELATKLVTLFLGGCAIG